MCARKTKNIFTFLIILILFNIPSASLFIYIYSHLSKGMTAKVKIQLTNRPIPLETFKDNKQLGRVMLRKGGETVAAGVVDEVT